MDAVPYYTQKAKEKEAFNRKIEKEVNKEYENKYDDYGEPISFRELWHDLTDSKETKLKKRKEKERQEELARQEKLEAKQRADREQREREIKETKECAGTAQQNIQNLDNYTLEKLSKYKLHRDGCLFTSQPKESCHYKYNLYMNIDQYLSNSQIVKAHIIGEHHLRSSLLLGCKDSLKYLRKIYQNSAYEVIASKRKLEILDKILLESGVWLDIYECRRESGYKSVSLPEKDSLSAQATKVTEHTSYYIGRGANYLNSLASEPSESSAPRQLVGFGTAASRLTNIIKENAKKFYDNDCVDHNYILRTLRNYNDSVAEEFRLPDDTDYHRIIKNHPGINDKHPYLVAYRDVMVDNYELITQKAGIAKNVILLKKDSVVYGKFPDTTVSKSLKYKYNGNEIVVEKYRSITFPDSIKPGHDVTVSFPVSDLKGNTISQKDPMYLYIYYNSDGKLFKLSLDKTPFVPKSKTSSVFVEFKQELYTLPVSSGHYEHLIDLINTNSGVINIEDTKQPDIVELSGSWW